MAIWRNVHSFSYSFVLLYILAVVLANVSVIIFGPNVSILNAFLFIGFTLTSRDKLHDFWQGKSLAFKMALLILAGGILSAFFGAGRIAFASFVAFVASEGVDALVYHAMQSRDKRAQIRTSNLLAAMVDSLIFPFLAFGLPFLWLVMIGQFIAKTLGGELWARILYRHN